MSKEKLARPALSVLSEYLTLGSKFQNPPKVSLELATQATDEDVTVGARDIAIATGYQCYQPGVTRLKPRNDEKALGVADRTLDSGHHTTRQHIQYTFKLEGISRKVIHDVFHNHKYYNSEQQSQRYAEARMGYYLVPSGLTPEQRDLYLEIAEQSNKDYFELLPELEAEARRRLKATYPKGWSEDEVRVGRKAEKVAQEIARYVLPVAQLSNMDHSLNELQLIRLFRASQQLGFDDEARYVIARMIEEVAKFDPQILDELREPMERETRFGRSEEEIRRQKVEFDKRLGGRRSVIVPGSDNREVLARGVRNVLGLSEETLPDREALRLLMDPRENPLLADVFETTINDPVTQVLRSANYTFETKFSHSASSQAQRHRETPRMGPPLENAYDGEADYFVPMLIRESLKLAEKYQQIMEKRYKDIARLVDAGVPLEWAVKLLPNAQNLRVTESGDLLGWLHRIKLRSCLNAQEEVFFVTLDQVEQIEERTPETQEMLAAPCKVRVQAGMRPRCPEGDGWCGQQVFNWDLKTARAKRLI